MTYLRALLWPTLAILLATLAACGEPEPKAVVEPVALVTLAPAITADLPVMVHGYGSIEFDPSRKHTLNAEIEARLLELDATAGDIVEKDQVVARLVPSSAGSTEVAKARRDASAAEAAAARTKRLRADGLASDADVEAADTTARDLSEQAAKLAERSSAIMELRTPVDGIIDGMLAEPGDLIAPGTAIVRLASPEAIQARIGIEAEDTARVQVGDPVRLRSLDNSGSQLDGVIQLVDRRIDPLTRMAAALVTVDPEQGFLPGEAVEAEIRGHQGRGGNRAPRRGF